jgi:hypothetical protein
LNTQGNGHTLDAGSQRGRGTPPLGPFFQTTNFSFPPELSLVTLLFLIP